MLARLVTAAGLGAVTFGALELLAMGLEALVPRGRRDVPRAYDAERAADHLDDGETEPATGESG